MTELFSITLITNLLFFIFYKFISKKMNLFDNPDNFRKIHNKKIPNIGGFIFVINALILFIFYSLNQSLININLIFILIFSILFFLIGFVDDKKNLNPILKLIISAIVFYFSVFFNEELLLTGVNFTSLDFNIFFGKYSIFVSILCILLLLNALNMFDGINLQSGLYLMTIFFVFVFYKINEIFSIMMIFSLIFFLYLNYKNKLFLGNAGIWFCSFYIGGSIISSYNQNLINVEMVLILLLFPGLDMLRIFIQRISKKNHPFKPDKNHIHHILLKSYNNFESALIIFFCYLTPIIFFLLTYNFLISLVILVSLYFIIYIKFNYTRFRK